MSEFYAKYFYKKTDILSNVFTCCTLFDNETNLPLARGISICSVREQHIKKKSRATAFGRAMKAFVNKANSDEIVPIREDIKYIEKIIIGNEDKLERVKKEALDNGLELNVTNKNVDTGYKIKIPNIYSIQVTYKHFNWKSEFMPADDKTFKI